MNTSPISAKQATDLAEQITTIPGVGGLHGGAFGQVALYYPRQRVVGLRLTTAASPHLEVHMIADLAKTNNLHKLAEQVRAVASAAQPFTVDVIIEDITDHKEIETQ